MKLLIFDMDNCLFQTFKDGVATCANQSVEDVLDVIPNIDKRKVRRILYKFGVESVIKMFEVDSNVATKMREKWKELVASNIQPFEDVAVLSELKIPKVLVTTGMVHFQNSKINKLGIRDMFDEVIINSTDGLNELPSKNLFLRK